MIPIEIAKYFQSGTILIVSILSFSAFQKWQNMDGRRFLHDNKSHFGMIVIVLAAYSLLIGFRPLSSVYFCDTVNYANLYGLTKPENVEILPGKNEWLFDLMMAVCAKFFDVSVFFTFVMFGYMFFALGGLKRLFGNNIILYGSFFIFLIRHQRYQKRVGVRAGHPCNIFYCH